MNKKLTELLQPQELPINEAKKSQLLELGREQLAQQQATRFSFWQLFKITLRFISLKFWLAQLLVLGILLAYLLLMMNNQGAESGFVASYAAINSSISMLTLLFLFSNILIFGNLVTPFLHGMAPLEQTLKYSLREHLIMKLIVFGLYDLLLAIAIALFSEFFLALLFWQIVLFLLVPLNLLSLLLLSLLTIGRQKILTIGKCLVVGLFIGAFQIIASRTDIYQLPLLFWSIAYLLTAGVLGLLLYQNFHKKNWGQN
ncbi:hypothetical protein [Enterococcus sp. HY326]|uniref:hypothetical protein n=1 Tax=Enterococcus sp. HY326 TaxID=2971265 RepID=UPI0022407B3D|nr:hypothetical protein [Enterococcus sp. HY326]